MASAEAALYGFLSGAGVPAYPTSSVPEGAAFPYLTYDLSVGYWDSGEVNVPVRIWDRTTSEAKMNAAVRAMGSLIPRGGTLVSCDGGVLWVKRGTPWAQALEDGTDPTVKSRYLNVDIEFLIAE